MASVFNNPFALGQCSEIEKAGIEHKFLVVDRHGFLKAVGGSRRTLGVRAFFHRWSCDLTKVDEKVNALFTKYPVGHFNNKNNLEFLAAPPTTTILERLRTRFQKKKGFEKTEFFKTALEQLGSPAPTAPVNIDEADHPSVSSLESRVSPGTSLLPSSASSSTIPTVPVGIDEGVLSVNSVRLMRSSGSPSNSSSASSSTISELGPRAKNESNRLSYFRPIALSHFGLEEEDFASLELDLELPCDEFQEKIMEGIKAAAKKKHGEYLNAKLRQITGDLMLDDTIPFDEDLSQTVFDLLTTTFKKGRINTSFDISILDHLLSSTVEPKFRALVLAVLEKMMPIAERKNWNSQINVLSVIKKAQYDLIERKEISEAGKCINRAVFNAVWEVYKDHAIAVYSAAAQAASLHLDPEAADALVEEAFDQVHQNKGKILKEGTGSIILRHTAIRSKITEIAKKKAESDYKSRHKAQTAENEECFNVVE